MSPYFLLIPAVIVDALGAWLTYSHSDRLFYNPAMMGIGGVTGGLWTYGVALAGGDKQLVYWFDLLFMALGAGAYLAMPFFRGDVRVSWPMAIGIGMVAAGVLVVKLTLGK